MRKDKENGAIVVEATISLTAFVFAIFTILMLVNIAYIQAKMGVALNSAAKEISQYSFFYYKSGLIELDREASGDTADERDMVKETVDGVGEFITSMSNAQSNLETGDIEQMITEIQGGVEDVEALVTKYADEISKDPKGFIMGMGKMALVDLGQQGKAILGQLLAKTFMQKNLMAHKNDNPDAFLRRHNVVDGMKGLNFRYTTLMAYGEDQIQLVVTYKVRVIQLLNINFDFKFSQVAKTKPWGNGISLIRKDEAKPGRTPGSSEESLWNGDSDVNRGEVIIEQEKNKYTYTSSQKFDAYNPADNEFVSIITLNTFDTTYQKANNIKNNKISPAYTKMCTDVEALDETITVNTRSGGTAQLNSPRDTRKYRVVVVIPNNADVGKLSEAISQFREAWEGEPVTVQVVKGYGDYTPNAQVNAENNDS